MRVKLLTGLAIVVVAAGGCGGGDDGEATKQSPIPSGSMKATLTDPPRENVLKIGVESAIRNGTQVTLTLSGTYTGTTTTLWDATAIRASSAGLPCKVTADTGFPKGRSMPGSKVTGVWQLECTNTKPVDLLVDPFGGLTGTDTATRINLS